MSIILGTVFLVVSGLVIRTMLRSPPDLAGRPGWANTSGEMPSRRQAMARLIERWQELRTAAHNQGS